MRNAVCLLFLIFFTVNCSNNENSIPGLTALEDAPDLQVVENTDPLHEGQFWSLSAEPELSIGVNEGAEEYQLYRVYDAINLPGGNIMVSNSGTSELRVFDNEGTYIRSFGRDGRGPGEFGEFSSMRIFRIDSTTIGVNDRPNARVNIFDINGTLLRTVGVEPIEGAGNPSISDVFTDGSWLVWSAVGSARLSGQPGDIIEMDHGFHRLLSDGTYDSMLFSVPSRPRFVNQVGGITNYPYIPLTPDYQYATDNRNGVIVSRGDRAEIHRIDTSGVRTHIFRWEIPRQSVSEIWDRYEEDYLSGISEDRLPRYEHFLNQDLPLPEKVPAIGNVITDRLGYFWIQRYRLPWEETSNWDVLDADGQWLGTLELPAGIRITEIGEDYLLGRVVDGNGIEHVVIYGLNREAEG